tara:strand:+ start:7971 stop:8333 length:363 start_codon:yes stop_codon:yes gene_type:complete
MEENKEDKKYKYTFIKPDAKCNIEVGSLMFGRLQRLYFFMTSLFKSNEALAEALKLASTDPELKSFPKDKRSAYELQTVIMLLNEINKEFHQNPENIIVKDEKASLDVLENLTGDMSSEI